MTLRTSLADRLVNRMPFDTPTVLVFGAAAKVLVAATMLSIWLRHRRAVWLVWWACTYLFATLAGLVFFAYGLGGELRAIGAGVALIVTAFACCWQGARTFEGRRPLWLVLVGAPAIWLAFCLLPGFLDDLRLRVLVSSLLLAWLPAMAAVELWRGHRETLLSRAPAVALFGTLALVFASRIAFIDALPFPFGALPLQEPWVAAFHVILFVHAVGLTILLLTMTNERFALDRGRRRVEATVFRHGPADPQGL